MNGVCLLWVWLYHSWQTPVRPVFCTHTRITCNRMIKTLPPAFLKKQNRVNCRQIIMHKTSWWIDNNPNENSKSCLHVQGCFCGVKLLFQIIPYSPQSKLDKNVLQIVRTKCTFKGPNRCEYFWSLWLLCKAFTQRMLSSKVLNKIIWLGVFGYC